MPRAAKKAPDANLYVDDPVLAPKDAARYLGRARRTLNRLHLRRVPMPGVGKLWGYRRSTLNQYLYELERSRLHIPETDDTVKGSFTEENA